MNINASCFLKISNLSSRRQEILFLKQKYKDTRISRQTLALIMWTDELDDFFPNWKENDKKDANNKKKTDEIKLFDLFKKINFDEILMRKIIHIIKLFEEVDFYELNSISFINKEDAENSSINIKEAEKLSNLVVKTLKITWSYIQQLLKESPKLASSLNNEKLAEWLLRWDITGENFSNDPRQLLQLLSFLKTILTEQPNKSDDWELLGIIDYLNKLQIIDYWDKVRLLYPIDKDDFLSKNNKNDIVFIHRESWKILWRDEKRHIKKQIDIQTDMILEDLLHFVKLEKGLSELENDTIQIDWNDITVKNLTNWYQRKVLRLIKETKKAEKIQNEIWWFDYNEKHEEDYLGDIYWTWTIEDELVDPELQKIAWQYGFFKLVQDSVGAWYVFSHKDFMLINDLVEDLKNWKVVLLTWDTWSGKTELARFLCKQFLKTEYVFVSGNKDLEVSDLTLEKTITSKSPLSLDKNIVSKNIVDEKEFLEQEAEKIINNILMQESFRQIVYEIAEKNGKTDEQIDAIKKELEEMELWKKSLITEYHYMWIFLAAKNWQPCIIDEFNLTRQEIFMALNDYLTKRIWQIISLPNALWKITVKKWFCIILTWNDPEQNSKVERYSHRSKIDEASYNRMRTYAKNYFYQIDQTHNENRLEESHYDNNFGDINDLLYKTYEYLNENELYWVILMMMFGSKTKLNHSWKYWFEVMKEDFEWDNINKFNFLLSLKNFAKAIYTIQKAYSWNTVIISEWSNVSESIKDMIKRKVFSMRNLIEVLEAYKKDVLPLDYHIYNQFIKHTTNEKEKYWILLVFHKFGFFKDLVTDDMNNSLDNISKKREMFELKRWKISKAHIQNKILFTKEDLYKEYFWNFEISDNFFKSNNTSITESLSEALDTWLDEWNANFEISINSQYVIDTMQESLDLSIKLVDKKPGEFLSIQKITTIMKQIKSKLENNNYESKILKKIQSTLIEFNNYIRNYLDDDSQDFEVSRLVSMLEQININ